MGLNIKDIRKNVIRVLSGTILTEDFFLKNTRFMAIVFVIMVLYISNRYSCISKRAEIEALKLEMKDAKYESLTISSELTSVSRQTRVQSLVNNNGLALQSPSTPSYKIKKEEKE